MSDFNYNNNGSDFNNGGNKPPMQKSAIIVTVVMLGGIIVMFFGMRDGNMPIIMGGFFLAFITVFVAAMVQGKNKGAGGAKRGITVNTTQFNKYKPLLLDERTKQHPEVQRLLQYPAVQKAFFDPSSLSNSTIANDPHVQELFPVFDEMLAQAAIDGTVYGAQGNVTPTTVDPAQLAKQAKANKTPRSKLGTLLYFAGLAMFLLPFFTVFFMAMGSGKSTPALKAMSFILTGCAPIGMILIVISRFIKK